MATQPQVLSRTELDNSGFLGETVQVATVTDDLHRSLASLVALGIGPWAIYEVGPHNSDVHFRGEKDEISARIALAMQGEMMWEVIEPTGGRSLYQEFLDEGNRGLHHIAVDCNGIPYVDQVEGLRSRGFEEVSGGTAFGPVPFAYFHSGAPDSPYIEIFERSELEFPEPDEWYPAAPPGE
jgi:hypothetical protein